MTLSVTKCNCNLEPFEDRRVSHTTWSVGERALELTCWVLLVCLEAVVLLIADSSSLVHVSLGVLWTSNQVSFVLGPM